MNWFDFTTPAELWVFVAAVGASISALSAVALAIIAWRGLKSLQLAQRDMLTRAMRDARDCAIQRLRDIPAKLIPLHKKAAGLVSDRPMFVVDQRRLVFGEPAEYEQRDSAQEWVRGLNPDAFRAGVRLLNEMEVWATYFTAALADEDVAREPGAPVFLGIVVQFYPLLVHLRAQDNSGNFPGVVRLFQSWYGRADAEAVLELAKKLQTKGLQHKLPRPIGTEPLN